VAFPLAVSIRPAIAWASVGKVTVPVVVVPVTVPPMEGAVALLQA